MKEMTVVKLEEMEKKMTESEKNRVQSERDLKTYLTSEIEKQKLYVDGGVDSVRKLQEAESEKLRGRSVSSSSSSSVSSILTLSCKGLHRTVMICRMLMLHSPR